MLSDDSLLLGRCSRWFSSQLSEEGRYPYSFVQSRFSDIRKWKEQSREIFEQYILAPVISISDFEVVSVSDYDGLRIEKLRWSLPFGNPTEAYFLRPLEYQRPLPGVLALHGHARNKILGKSKITRVSDNTDSSIISFQQKMHEGRAWANELAKNGFAVLVHDVFPFESRLITPSKAFSVLDGVVDKNGDDYSQYNEKASYMESDIAKVLFSSGFTWPGLTLTEDRIALNILASREDVDENRLGCCGLSLGGMRAQYLSGSTDKIRCTVSAGFMTTWNDFILHHAIDHTWMYSIPGLSNLMGLSDIVSMTAPSPLLIQSCSDDELFSLDEVRKAEKNLRGVYEKAGFPDHFDHRYYKGSHRFSTEMQTEAFDWLSRWL